MVDWETSEIFYLWKPDMIFELEVIGRATINHCIETAGIFISWVWGSTFPCCRWLWALVRPLGPPKALKYYTPDFWARKPSLYFQVAQWRFHVIARCIRMFPLDWERVAPHASSPCSPTKAWVTVLVAWKRWNVEQMEFHGLGSPNWLRKDQKRYPSQRLILDRQQIAFQDCPLLGQQRPSIEE